MSSRDPIIHCPNEEGGFLIHYGEHDLPTVLIFFSANQLIEYINQHKLEKARSILAKERCEHLSLNSERRQLIISGSAAVTFNTSALVGLAYKGNLALRLISGAVSNGLITFHGKVSENDRVSVFGTRLSNSLKLCFCSSQRGVRDLIQKDIETFPPPVAREIERSMQKYNLHHPSSPDLITVQSSMDSFLCVVVVGIDIALRDPSQVPEWLLVDVMDIYAGHR